MSLRYRLFLLALLALIPALAIQLYNEVELRRARESEVRELAVRQAKLAASEVDRIVEGVRAVLTAVARAPSVQAFDAPRCLGYLKSLEAQFPHLVSIAALDRDGLARCRETQPSDVSFADRSYFKQAIVGAAFVTGEYTVGRMTGRKVLPLAVPLRDPAGEIVGVVVASLDLDWLGEELARRGLPEGGSITLADRNGTIIARQPLPERFVGTKIPEPYLRLLDAPSAGATEVVSQDGTRRILGYVPLGEPPRNIYVSTGLSTDAAYAVIEAASRRGLLLIALGFVLAMLAAWAAGRWFIQRPVERLLAAVERWRTGDLSAGPGVASGSGELGRLGEAFYAVVRDVRSREDAVRERDERIRLALEAGRMGTWWYDPATKRRGWTPTAGAMLGAPQQTEASYEEWRALIHPDDLPAVEAALERVAAGGGDYEMEYRVRTEDGSVRWLQARGTLVHRTGLGDRMVGVIMDVTERKRSEQRQKLLVDELNHRVKNVLATVQSIAAQTVRSAPDPAEFRREFDARLRALAETHEVLIRQDWREAEVGELVAVALKPYRREGVEAWTLSGPPVRVNAVTALVLGLAFHELATNAAKYGALSRPEGRVDVTWRLSGEGGERSLVLDWVERGGPPVSAPTRRGFGSRLLERGLTGELRGRATQDFAPTGLVCHIEVPLPAERDPGADALAAAIAAQ